MPFTGPEHLTPDQFLAISADLAYRLSGTAFDPRTLLEPILEGIITVPCSTELLLQAIKIIHIGYGDRRRRLGPLAVLHPLRVTVIIARLTKNPSTLDLLGSLLHDRDEDLTVKNIGDDKRWIEMKNEMDKLLGMLDEQHRWYLGERLDCLTIKHKQEYCEYLSKLMNTSRKMPDLIRIKLADRLDNTLDIGVFKHGIAGRGAYGTIFDLLFLPSFEGFKAPASYVPLTEGEGVQILANIFKNAEFLSILRAEKIRVEGATEILYNALLAASTRITRNIIQDILVTSLSVAEQREIVVEVQDYSLNGGLQSVRDEGSSPLDGLFLKQYGGKEGRRKRLLEIYKNKAMVLRIAVAFLAVFANFKVNPNYFIQGLDGSGFHPI
jgi:hypothetical protein